MTSRLVRILTLILVMLLCVGCDQAAKSVARDTLAGQPPVYLLAGILRLTYAENSGAFLSLGADMPPFARTLIFGVGVAGILIGAVVYTLRAGHLTLGQAAGLALIAGGGVGNLIDRVLHQGSVVDYAVLRLGPFSTGVFNLADLAIMGGLALFALASWQADHSNPQSVDADSSE
jgi:signal peptidase II